MYEIFGHHGDTPDAEYLKLRMRKINHGLIVKEKKGARGIYQFASFTFCVWLTKKFSHATNFFRSFVTFQWQILNPLNTAFAIDFLNLDSNLSMLIYAYTWIWLV